MRLTRDDGSRKVAIYRVYESIKVSEEEYQKKHNECEIYNKLADLEDIEQELGIDLITLFKALRDSIAIKNEDGTIIVMWACPRFQISLDYETAWILYGPLTEQKVLNIKDYGKTWALTKEELK